MTVDNDTKVPRRFNDFDASIRQDGNVASVDLVDMLPGFKPHSQG